MPNEDNEENPIPQRRHSRSVSFSEALNSEKGEEENPEENLQELGKLIDLLTDKEFNEVISSLNKLSNNEASPDLTELKNEITNIKTQLDAIKNAKLIIDKEKIISFTSIPPFLLGIILGILITWLLSKKKNQTKK